MVGTCMSHSDDPALWMRFAHDDLHAAQSDVALHLCCFHAQQAAEKPIKAVLVLHDIDFPWVHDLAHLSALVPDNLHATALDEAVVLTPYGTAARYPKRTSSYTTTLAAEAVELARAVVTWAASIIEPNPTDETP